MKGFSEKLTEKIDILIVGAGPVGLTLANFLGLRGLSGLIIDKLMAPYSFPRAISLDHDALRIFHQIGLNVEELNLLTLKEVVFNSSLFGDLVQLDMSDGCDTFPKLVSFHQPDLEKKLREKLHSYKNFPLFYGLTLKNYYFENNRYQVFLEDEKGEGFELSCSYLIGADWFRSL